MVLGAVERIRLRRESEIAMQTYIVLEERNRLARELHDSVSQALYGIVLSIKTIQAQLDNTSDQLDATLDYALSLSQSALSEMRALIFELRPETLEKEGLIEALNRQLQMIQVRHGLVVSHSMTCEPSIPVETKEHIYWIVREALHNIVKHARASQISVQLYHTDSDLIFEISDDGIGFDTRADFPGHLGLHSMSERAAREGGSLTIISEPNNGTNVRLCIPLAKPSSHRVLKIQ